MSVLRRWQYLAFLAPVVAAQVTACGGSTEPPPAATTIVATPSVVTLSALGETRQLTAKVLDQHGDSMPNASVTWSSNPAGIAAVSGSGLVTAVGNGAAQVTATSGTATGQVAVTVAQAAAALVKVSGDLQTGTVGAALGSPLVVQANDANGNPVANAAITFAVSLGLGSVGTASASTQANGQAQSTWTLGTLSGTIHRVAATLTATPAVVAQFNATANAAAPTTIAVVSGGDQFGFINVALASPVIVRAADQFNNATPNVTVAFSVTAGGGSVTPGAPITGTNGQAQTSWTLGPSGGTQTLQASASGVAGVQVGVNATASNLSITSVSPNPIVEGQSATIAGTGFSTTPSSNAVTVGGTSATVTSASATSLTITVPTSDCQPSRSDTVVVSVSGLPSNKFVHPRRPASFTTMAVGQQVILRSPADLCLQFDRVAALETYIIGVQSTSETPSSLTASTFTSVVAPGGAPAPPFAARVAASPSRQAPSTAMLERAERWTRHRQAEASIRAWERARFGPMLAGAIRPSAAGVRPLTRIPPVVNVGDTVAIRFPDIVGGNLCNFISISTVVRAVGTKGVWLEDVGNPAGYSVANFQSLSNQLDSPIYDTDVAYFGTPSDIEGNGRIVVVVTKEVNKSPGILGFVTNADMFPPASCPSSNQGELFYGRAPDPLGTFGGVYTVANAVADAPFLIAHEFSHIIQFSQRIALGAPNMASWTAEGQATMAEEVNGHAAEGRAPGQNLGFLVAFNQDNPSSTDWYSDAFTDLALYYGFLSSTTRAVGAPEECTFLASNIGPCLSSRAIYGIPWSILRWLNDQYGSTFPGGEQALQRALVANTNVGYANITSVVGSTMDSILARWAAMLYVDDRFAGMPALLKLSSWNLADVETGLFATARLTPRFRGYGDYIDNINIRAGSSAYYQVSAATHAATAVRARSTAGAALPSIIQMWVVRVQ